MNLEYSAAVAMVRPAAFQFNTATANTNHFQKSSILSKEEVLANALHEFDEVVNCLRNSGIEVLVLFDSPQPVLPDAIFPNNWFISLPGEIILCPMHAVSRRAERRQEHLKELFSFTESVRITDWSDRELQNESLEGTGSLILDRKNKIAFACKSERTSDTLFEKFCNHAGYEGFLFEATDRAGQSIYHTNVMMCLGNGFAVACEDAIVKDEDRKRLRNIIKRTGRELITINVTQMENFAGNMLQLQNINGEHILMMSSRAFISLLPQQIEKIEKFTRILTIDVSTIESIGGGSVRCMIAELQLPKIN
ncbi:MAG: amidinotransferase [Chitinophagaceae bacterium]|nr:MAG: amidinotransferase [Chitinophagaceae bacterium]